MVSFGTELSLAFWMASARVGLPSGLPPPVRAATSMARMSLAKSLPRRASLAPFWCLMVDHLEWPDMGLPLSFVDSGAPAVRAPRGPGSAWARPGLGRIGRLPVDAAGVGGTGEVDEPAVQALVPGQLRVEGDRQQVAMPCRDHPTVDLGEHLEVGAGVRDPGRADEGARDRAAVDPLDVHLSLERGHLAAEGVAAHPRVEHPEQVLRRALERRHPEAAEDVPVLADVALVGQDADGRGLGHGTTATSRARPAARSLGPRRCRPSARPDRATPWRSPPGR